MTLDDYQAIALGTASLADTQKDALILSALGLCGEAGEFTDLVKKIIYHNHPMNTEKLCEELGDILWYVARACSALNISMNNIARANTAKLSTRYPEGFSSERSINRE